MKKYIYEIRYFILIQLIFDGLFTLTNACIPYIHFTSIMSILITKITSKKLSQKRNIYLKQMAEYVSKIKDFLEGFKLIQSKTKPNIIKEHNKTLKITTLKRYSYGKYKTFANSISYFSISCVSITAFILVGLLLLKKEITVGTGVATFGYITCFIAPIESVLYDINSINSLSNTKAKVLASLKGSKKNPLKDKNTFENSIKFDNVSFKYKNFNIDSLSFTFEKGKKYALIGANGSGKSTVLNLMMKYIKPLAGEILIDDKNISLLNTNNIMGSINQNEHIFADNYINNTTIFSSYDAPRDAEILNSLSDKMVKSIQSNENSQLLSGGEKQVLAVIRMLTANTEICLMDEPYASMDVTTAESMQNFMMELKEKTIIVVTHNLSNALEKFDEVILMENGSIIQHGSYNQIQNTPEFKKLKNQFK